MDGYTDRWKDGYGWMDELICKVVKSSLQVVVKSLGKVSYENSHRSQHRIPLERVTLHAH